jgi:hypothetical protein
VMSQKAQGATQKQPFVFQKTAATQDGFDI